MNPLVIKLNQVDSTNTYLMELSKSPDVKHLTFVWAKNQTKGRGQQDRQWESEEGKSLTFSFLMRNMRLDRQFILNKMVAVVCCQSLEKLAPQSNVQIKWPNDLLINNKKVGGILVEAQLVGNQVKKYVIGIGININQESFPNLPLATSVYIETQKNNKIDDVFALMYSNLSSALENPYFEKDENKWDLLYQSYLAYLRQSCQINVQGELKEGILLGVNRQGELVMDFDGHIDEFIYPMARLDYEL